MFPGTSKEVPVFQLSAAGFSIVRCIDIYAEQEYNYEYEGGRLIRATECDITLDGEIVTSKTLVNSVIYVYDDEGTLKKKRIIPINADEQVIFYEYPENENTVVKFVAGGKTITSHSKSDSFGRTEFNELQLGSGFISRRFTYHDGAVSQAHVDHEKLKSSPTTQLIKNILYSTGNFLIQNKCRG